MMFGNKSRVALLILLMASNTLVAADVLPEPGVAEDPIDSYDREHWSFQPPVHSPRPSVQDTSWSRTPVDEFVLSELERKQLRPAPRAGRATLLRRVKLDLLGLPPTPEELDAFITDTAPGAYGRLVDRMLSSPAYGERWAQHWLDLARFAETDGFEHDKVREHAWQYRQWVVDALNEDMPYDEFVRLQVCGDLSPRHQDAVATMFCLAGPDMPDINEQDLRRHNKLNEIAATVGSALLGLQVQCAQCHDHKYDPISQADFFRLRGIFESAVPVMRRDQAVAELSAQPHAVTPLLYLRGQLESPGPAVAPRPPRIACSPESYATFDTDDPRRAFVDWIFAEEHPLTGRVIANRLWQHHFGKGLCDNPSDFGVVPGGPTHPELLDWLAIEMRRSGWSIKHMHRLILASATYQQAGYASADDPVAQRAMARAKEADAENGLYSRYPRQRLQGEVIRDALLAVSNGLDRRYGGPSVMPPLPPELLETLLPGQWRTSDNPGDQRRRSIYVFARRNLRYPLFDAFDRPDAGASCAVRSESTTAIQSLHMLNSDLAFDAAVGLRDRLLRDSPAPADASDLVRQLFRITFARDPTAREAAELILVLDDSATDRSESLLAICLAVLNANEFVYVD